MVSSLTYKEPGGHQFQSHNNTKKTQQLKSTIILRSIRTEVTGQTAAPKLDREMDTDNQSLPGAEAHSWSQYPL